MSATSRLPTCRTTWQLFPWTVPKLLLFLPSIVNVLPISPGEGVFSPVTPRPIQHFYSPSPKPCVPLLHASTRLHTPRTLALASAPSTCAFPPRVVPPCSVCCDIWLFRPYYTPNSPKTQHSTRRTSQGRRETWPVCCDIRRNRARNGPKNQKTQHTTRQRADLQAYAYTLRGITRSSAP